MRLLGLILLLVVAFTIPFILWGDAFAQWLTGDGAITWLRGFGGWAWLVVIALLVSDLFLPIPATPVISAAGYLYGLCIGGLVSAGGSILSGMLAYLLCRKFGRRAAARLAGEAELARSEAWFDRRGAWLVALSRWLPLLPEVIACLAGLSRMRFSTFALALACGSLPMGFAYAAIGAAGKDYPRAALALSALVPALLWAVVQRMLRKREGAAA